MTPFRHILVPVDFGETTDRAIELALSVASMADAHITLLHAFDVTPFMNASAFLPSLDTAPILEALHRDVAALREGARTKWSKVDGLVREGNVYDVILDVAKAKGCDLIVIGTHGRRGVSHVLLGSVTEKVVRLAPIPVLTVRPASSASRAGTAT
jgi:nucleotide-binding universal stress UspA family protein